MSEAKSDRLIRGATGDWEVVIGMEVHAQVTSKAKLFSGASTEFGGAPNSPRLAGRCRHARHAAGDQRRMRAPGGAHRARAQCQDQSEIGVRPQELFLSRPAAGLPDQPVQAADRGRGRSRRRSRRRRERERRHRTAASRAGRRQEPARPLADHVLRRPQSLRRRADGDRVEARSALGRRGHGVPDQDALDPALSRHLRRRHGKGLACAPTSMSRCASPARRSARAAKSRT